MPMGRARRACPQAAFVAPRFDRYQEKSREVMAILESVTPLVEQLSIDEAFLDVGGARRLLGTGVEIAQLIRERVRRESGLIASVGVATTKFLAKLASDLSKPDGLLVVEPGTEEAFLAPLPASRLWGVGPATLRKLERMSVATIRDIAALPEPALTAALGTALGQKLLALAHNDDPRPVVPERETKSIGAEETFAKDLRTREECDHELVHIVDRVAARLRDAGCEARTVTLKFRYANFETKTRARTLPDATMLGVVVIATVRELLDAVEFARGVRLLGVSLSHLGPASPTQGTLDLGGRESIDDAQRQRHADVERAVDAVRERFGTRAVGPASVVAEGSS
jgi:DNA polymerase-4